MRNSLKQNSQKNINRLPPATTTTSFFGNPLFSVLFFISLAFVSDFLLSSSTFVVVVGAQEVSEGEEGYAPTSPPQEEKPYRYSCPPLRPIKGFENVSLGSGAGARPFVLGSKIGWLDVLGFSPEHIASCPVSCLWVNAPDEEQCLDELDALVFSNAQPPPRPFRKTKDQVWGFFTLESAGNYPEITDKEYQIPFETVSTYRLDSDLPITYFPSDPHALLRPVNFTKTGEILYLQKNCIPQRDNIVSNLMQHIHIDSPGVCLKNTIYPANVSTLEMLSRYRFVIMIENSYADDWVTERIFNAWIAGTVPVYLGAPNVADFAPSPSAFIDFRDFPDLKDLASYLKSFEGGQREEEYAEFFEWKNSPLESNMISLLQTSMYVPPPPPNPGEIPESWRAFRPSLAGDVTQHRDRNEWGEIQGRDFHRAQKLESCRLCMKLKSMQDHVKAHPVPYLAKVLISVRSQLLDAQTGDIVVDFGVQGFQNLKDGEVVIRAESNNRVWHVYVVESALPLNTIVQYSIPFATEWKLGSVTITIEAINRKRRVVGFAESTISLN